MKLLHDNLDAHAAANVALGRENLANLPRRSSIYILALSGAYEGGILLTDPASRSRKSVFSDRDLHDDTDAVNRINHFSAQGLRNDIEIY